MDYNNPLVFVVIPAFNRPGLVVRAVRNALTQTLDAIEVIVVTHGPDGANEIIYRIQCPVLRKHHRLFGVLLLAHCVAQLGVRSTTRLLS